MGLHLINHLHRINESRYLKSYQAKEMNYHSRIQSYWLNESATVNRSCDKNEIIITIKLCYINESKSLILSERVNEYKRDKSIIRR